MPSLLSKRFKTSLTELISFFFYVGTSWVMVETFTVLATLVNDDLLVYLQRQQFQKWFFTTPFNLIWFSIAYPLSQKLCTSSPYSAFDTLPGQIFRYLAAQGDLNALQRKTIPENKSAGKLSNILTTSFRYYGLNVNRSKIKSSLYI